MTGPGAAIGSQASEEDADISLCLLATALGGCPYEGVVCVRIGEVAWP